MIEITKRFKWDMGHRLVAHEGKCRHLHGHEYKLFVTVVGVQDEMGRVIDFGQLKQIVGDFINSELDHNFMLQLGDPLIPVLEAAGEQHIVSPFAPTAENIIEWMAKRIDKLLEGSTWAPFPAGPVRLAKLELWETENCFATWRRDDWA